VIKNYASEVNPTLLKRAGVDGFFRKNSGSTNVLNLPSLGEAASPEEESFVLTLENEAGIHDAGYKIQV
jgi:hypothetical protein